MSNYIINIQWYTNTSWGWLGSRHIGCSDWLLHLVSLMAITTRRHLKFSVIRSGLEHGGQRCTVAASSLHPAAHRWGRRCIRTSQHHPGSLFLMYRKHTMSSTCSYHITLKLCMILTMKIKLCTGWWCCWAAKGTRGGVRRLQNPRQNWQRA